MRKYDSVIEKSQIGIFFYVNGKFLFHSCNLNDAENYGEFLVYSQSHFCVWERHYTYKYKVDFDYFPRGRVAYRKADDTFQILYDKCVENEIVGFIGEYYKGEKILLGYDEHYQCYGCNGGYVI